MEKFLLSSLLLLSFSAQAVEVKNLKRFAFGSCSYQEDDQPLWADIIAQRPDLFAWGGDAIYADWQDQGRTIAQAYEKQNAHPEYVKFKQSGIPITGVWDDHDYAYDNADGNLADKKESQRLFLDFIEEPADSPRRQQEGIYWAQDFNSDGRKVKLIFLDNRYFKDVESDAWMLGKKQWEWLENVFKTSDADAHLIMTGLSIHSPLLRYTEEWPEYPAEFDRLHGLLDKYNPKGRVFLTGDKHFSSIFMRWGELEFMSSGMTHVVDRRVWWYLGRRYATTWFGLGYGQIDFEWEGNNPLITMQIRTTNRGEIHLSKFRWEKDHWNWLSKKRSSVIDEREQECCNSPIINKEISCVLSPSGSCSSADQFSLAPTWPVNTPFAAPSPVQPPARLTSK